MGQRIRPADTTPMTTMPSHPDISIFGINYPPEPTGIAPYTGALAAGMHRLGYQVTAHVSHPHYPQWAISEALQSKGVCTTCRIRLRGSDGYCPS
jgi:hypothetical protein